jgi:predicted MFS family arabinose efflux permease
MAAAFIPVLAARLAGGAEGGSTAGGIAASIPQSAETLLTCAAIFITSELIIRTGWKVPFLAGLAFVVGGTALSGMAASLPVFIAARAVVGLGYGFCWMTLRNLALLGRSTEERNYGFALLNAGLYAGMNCGSVMGSILAEIIGYANVFFIAAALTALCACVIIGLENGKIKRDKPDAPKTAAAKTAGNSGIGTLISFLILLIAPACIAGSYTGYFLPLYASELGYGTADVGRAQLLYGVIIIYLAPKLSVFIRKRLGGGIKMSVLYNLLLAAALVITGIFGGFGAALIAVLIIALGDGFGFGAQNNYFLAIPCMSRLPESRALSILSFLKKLAEMAGPLTFAAVMGLSAAARPPFGVLLMGVLFAAFALFALWTTRPKRS